MGGILSTTTKEATREDDDLYIWFLRSSFHSVKPKRIVSTIMFIQISLGQKNIYIYLPTIDFNFSSLSYISPLFYRQKRITSARLLYRNLEK